MIQANDLAHKAMLRDLIPLVAIHKEHTDKEFAGFRSRLDLEISKCVCVCVMCSYLCRLHDFLKEKSLKLCGENAGYGGTCITDHDTVNLWRLYLEVLPL